MKILVLGVSGMLGHKVFEVLSKDKNLEVWGSVTNIDRYMEFIPKDYKSKIISGVLADKIESVKNALDKAKPQVVINCIGIIKQNDRSKEWKEMIELNALFPHKLAKLAEDIGAKVITVATDCVFDGSKIGKYLESDIPTAHEPYGMSKYLGELHYGDHLTLRTSIIGHELNSELSLLDWFLSVKEEKAKGYRNAIFSGLTTLELARFINKYCLNDNLKGLYHLSVEPISKYDLLNMVAKEYGKSIKIMPDDTVKINRALDSTRIREVTGYIVPEWEKLISELHNDFLNSQFYNIKRKQHGK